MRQWYKLVVFGDIFPIVHKHGLDMIGHGNVDHWFAVESVLLKLVRLRPEKKKIS